MAKIKAQSGNTRLPIFVWNEYHIDQQINDRGIALDLDLVKQAIRLDAAAREKHII